ncbi:cysteine desulfurase [Candidatus Woesearchaeota archaeon]|nr:cysteine desulfurase [Candidatus Woesearchaeota archaeon]
MQLHQSYKMELDVEKIRKDFPILARLLNKKQLIYFDSAATSQCPRIVIDSIKGFYEKHNANIHRGIHKLAEESTLMYEEAHQKVADFINADFEEIIFTKNTTEALNLLAYSLLNDLKENDEIILSQMEHHSNIVPWQQLAKLKKVKINYVKVTEEGKLNLIHLKSLINEKTRIVSITHVSNLLGTINPVKEISEIAHEKNIIFIVDAAQSIPHMKVDVKDIDADFLVFSGHKMCAPTGIGVLYGKKVLLEKISPFLYGGDMIKEVTFENTRFNDLPWKFEAGTPPIAEGIALGVAVDYLNSIGMENIEEYEDKLTQYLYKKLKEQKDVKIYGPEKRSSLVSFNLYEIHPHDVATILDSEGIAIRAGHMCAMPLVKEVLNESAVCRISLYFYNTKEEIDKFILALDKVRKVFGK